MTHVRNNSNSRLTFLNKLFVLAFVFLASSCTKASLFSDTNSNNVFAGLEEVRIADDGSLSLSWKKIQSEKVVNYLVYMRGDGEEYDFLANPYKMVTNTATIDLPSYPLNQKYCFVVRYSIVGIEPDTNSNEICPDLPYVKSFEGIKSVVSTDTGQVTITWDSLADTDGIAGYRVYLGDGFEDLKASVGATTTQALVNNLVADTDYSFGVRVVDKYGREDANTLTKPVTTKNFLAPVFDGIKTATVLSSSSAKLTWTAATGNPSAYNIYMASGAANTTPVVTNFLTPFKTVSASISEYTVTGLGDDLAYTFVIRATSSGGQESKNTESKTIVTPDSGAPLFSGIKTVLFASGSANITWDEAVGETKEYKIYYSSTGTINYVSGTYVTVTAPASSGSVSGLSDNTTYTFAVRAFDSHNQNDTNTTTRQATSSDLTPPLFLGYVSSSAVSETAIDVVFQRSIESDVSHYSVTTRVTGSGANFTEKLQVAQNTSGNLTASLTGLLPATSYDILIKAVDSSGNFSTNSSALVKATLDQTAPNFGGVTSAAKKTADITKMVVNWNAATDTGGIFEYKVYYSTQSLQGKSFSRSDTFPKTIGAQTIYSNSTLIGSGSTSVELSGLTSNTTYYFVVRATDNSGNEDQNSIQVSALVPDYTPPSAPTGLAFSPAPGAATTNRIPFVSGNGAVGTTARIYADSTLVGQQDVSAGGTFNIQISLPNVSKVYVVTAVLANAEGVESNSASVGNYNLQIDPPTATLSGGPTDGSITSTAAVSITVAGANVTQYKWASVNGGSSCTSGVKSAVTPVATALSYTPSSDGSWKLCVWGSDNLSNEQPSATELTWTLDTTAPTVAATITNAPTGNSNSTNVDITIGGTDISYYKYVFTTQSIACSNGGLSYSNWTPVATHVTGNPGADGDIRLCIQGADGAYNLAPLSSADWSKLSAAPTLYGVVLSDKTTGSTTMSNVQNVNAVLSGSATLSQGCFKTTNSTPAAGDSCWGSTSQTVSLTTVNASNTVYAWGRDTLGNIQTTPTSSSITWTNVCDSGTMDTTCTITSSHTVSNGAKVGGVGSITVSSGGSINLGATYTGTIQLPTGSMTIENGGAINGNFTVTAINVDIQSGGVFSANGLGYAGGTSGINGSAPAGNLSAAGSAGTTGGGGAHGGLGATGQQNCSSNFGAGGSVTYGSASAPTTFGAGGGGGNGQAGKPGGGAIRFNLSGNLTVNGTVSADGSDYTNLTYYMGGAGAGGSVWVTAANILGSGAITANGGNVLNYQNYVSGAGGGGRIAITGTSNLFHGSLAVNTGKQSNHASECGRASSGTIYIDPSSNICDSGSLSTTCTISQNILLTNGYSISGSGNLIVNSGVTVSVHKPGDTISIAMGGDVTINGTISANVSSLTAANLTIGAAGSLNANSLGSVGGNPYSNGSGSGGGTYANNFGGGGGFGGAGGQGNASGSNGGATYGSLTNPVSMGSGGAGSNCALGGNGGGYIKLNISSNLVINGALESKGATGSNASGTCSLSGAGSGGALHITASNISGTGTISVAGGAGAVVTNSGGGGGGGGRLYLNTPNPFRGSSTSSVSIAGGDGNFTSSGAAYLNYNGKSGTIYYAQTPCDSGSSSTTCTLSNYLYVGNATLVGTGNLVVASGGNLFSNRLEDATINFSGNVSVQNGGSITANIASLTAVNLDIESGGSINANALGYPGVVGAAGTGTGAGSYVNSIYYAGGGGAYGGNGGGAYSSVSGGSYYGNKLQPQSYGSSGGGVTTYGPQKGGDGGGRIRINISGTLTVDGVLSANGQDGITPVLQYQAGTGGGSGGALWISAPTVAGAGSITATGGVGKITNSHSGGSGGGSGGRIAYDSNSTFTFSGSLSVAGGAFASGSTGATAGSVGSLCANGGGGGCIN